MHHKNLPIYAIQFHPEVTHTKNGLLILRILFLTFVMLKMIGKWMI